MAPSSPAITGPSSTTHSFLNRISYVIADKVQSGRFTNDDHKATRRAVDTFAAGAVMLSDEIHAVNKDLSDAVEGFNAQLVGLTADHAEAPHSASSSLQAQNMGSLITASNKHAENAVAMNGALNNIITRTRRLESTSVSVTGFQATLNSHDRTLKAILHRISALSGTAPQEPSASDASLLTAPMDVETWSSHQHTCICAYKIPNDKASERRCGCTQRKHHMMAVDALIDIFIFTDGQKSDGRDGIIIEHPY
ncbi:hypothetical protein B0H19DRAFT_1272860 [Mycena capillaripes]|nr:hypothetical protein B0H19DRAFT_1272860 [Mycena capillaripes]